MPKQHGLSPPHGWLDRYGDYLFRYTLLRVRHTDIAEDLVQETFLAAFQAQTSFRGDAPERVWLLGILKHKIVDYYRKATSEGSLDSPVPDDWRESFDERGHWKTRERAPQEWTLDPGTILERREFWEVVIRCLGELPSRQAHAFILRTIEGLGGDQVCEQLHISETNLYVTLYRARLHLRRCLEIHWQGL